MSTTPSARISSRLPTHDGRVVVLRTACLLAYPVVPGTKVISRLWPGKVPTPPVTESLTGLVRSLNVRVTVRWSREP